MNYNRKCVKARLIGKSENEGYINLGFELVDTSEYLIATVCPNWRGEIPNYGELIILEYEVAIAGVTGYFDEKHKYTAIYFISYVPIAESVVNKEIIL